MQTFLCLGSQLPWAIRGLPGQTMDPNRFPERQGVIYCSSFHTCLPDENAPEVHFIIHSHFLSLPFFRLLSQQECCIDFIEVAHVTLLCSAADPPARGPLRRGIFSWSKGSLHNEKAQRTASSSWHCSHTAPNFCRDEHRSWKIMEVNGKANLIPKYIRNST